MGEWRLRFLRAANLEQEEDSHNNYLYNNYQLVSDWGIWCIDWSNAERTEGEPLAPEDEGGKLILVNDSYHHMTFFCLKYRPWFGSEIENYSKRRKWQIWYGWTGMNGKEGVAPLWFWNGVQNIGSPHKNQIPNKNRSAPTWGFFPRQIFGISHGHTKGDNTPPIWIKGCCRQQPQVIPPVSSSNSSSA